MAQGDNWITTQWSRNKAKNDYAGSGTGRKRRIYSKLKGLNTQKSYVRGRERMTKQACVNRVRESTLDWMQLKHGNDEYKSFVQENRIFSLAGLTLLYQHPWFCRLRKGTFVPLYIVPEGKELGPWKLDVRAVCKQVGERGIEWFTLPLRGETNTITTTKRVVRGMVKVPQWWCYSWQGNKNLLGRGRRWGAWCDNSGKKKT